MRHALLCGIFLLWSGCGSRSEAPTKLPATPTKPVSTELCNGLDDDGKNGVDDPFRDGKTGLYNSDQHCGACNQACTPRPDSEIETHCSAEAAPAHCVATRCVAGFGPTRDGHCAKLDERLCLACASDDDCGSLKQARCASVAGESRCSTGCALGCPDGYSCDTTRDLCLPTGGSCSCDPGDDFDFACSPDTRLPGAPVCVGRASCSDGVATSCLVGVEICDEQDNDCDGLIDEDFRDELGAYSRDPAHCGQCGSSCLEDTGLEQQLVCGGDPFAPRCALACPDSLDGLAPGDRLDGDLDLTTGCECVVQRLDDLPGPTGAQGQLLDQNCDGADGNVRQSFYVAGDGDDSWPGSPTRPLRTLATAMLRARESLSSKTPRPHVFVASGSYTETLVLADGVQVHGGYRRDFRALDPAAFLVEVRAPRGTSAPGGAALVGIDVGRTATRLEWMSLRGLDATDTGAAVGGYLERPGRNLVLSSINLRAGVPAEGKPGADGVAGTGAITGASVGEVPRAALEDSAHNCVQTAGNRAGGGSGGAAKCGAVDVSGGRGGASACPLSAGFQEPGQSGFGPNVGIGGQGGQDSNGPTFTSSCGGTVCCGLADFSVPTNFEGPRPGANGGDGRVGGAGGGCSDARGRFMGQLWSGGTGIAGNDGEPGSGGGGGGSGGGAAMQFVRRECEFPDGLGGGGGGGGAGGCGGSGGRAGQSGAPSLALLVVNPENFVIANVVFATATGGRGGSGGAGGDGGSGGTGASGGSLPMSARTTPTLAGPFPGARGGSGGSGGAGGGGGGGCGGASIGLWIVGTAPANLPAWQTTNRFELAAAGTGGAGGGGAQAGSRGAAGEAANVVVQ